jgi:hypothetical protein
LREVTRRFEGARLLAARGELARWRDAALAQWASLVEEEPAEAEQEGC